MRQKTATGGVILGCWSRKESRYSRHYYGIEILQTYLPVWLRRINVVTNKLPLGSSFSTGGPESLQIRRNVEHATAIVQTQETQDSRLGVFCYCICFLRATKHACFDQFVGRPPGTVCGQSRITGRCLQLLDVFIRHGEAIELVSHDTLG
jgi:hypothetical protein